MNKIEEQDYAIYDKAWSTTKGVYIVKTLHRGSYDEMSQKLKKDYKISNAVFMARIYTRGNICK